MLVLVLSGMDCCTWPSSSPMVCARTMNGAGHRRWSGCSTWLMLATILCLASSCCFSSVEAASGCEGKACRHHRKPNEENVFVRPTVSPYPTQTPWPTRSPTASPAPTVTRAPTESPQPTEMPSISVGPTTSPWPTATASPTSICTVDEAGRFGSGTGIATIVDYFYQVETMAEANEDAVSEEIAPSTERAIASTLFPLLFPEECQSPLIRRLQGVQRRLTTVGFSSRPTDRVLSGVPCQVQKIDGNNNCFLVDGGFTLVTSSINLEPGLLDSLQLLLESAMNSGAFDNVDDRVVKITYIPESDVRNVIPNTGNESDGNGEDQDDGGLPIYAWVLIGTGVACTSLLLYFVAQSNRKQQQDEKTALVGEGSFDGVGTGGGQQVWQQLDSPGSQELSQGDIDDDRTAPIRNY